MRHPFDRMDQVIPGRGLYKKQKKLPPSPTTTVEYRGHLLSVRTAGGFTYMAVTTDGLELHLDYNDRTPDPERDLDKLRAWVDSHHVRDVIHNVIPHRPWVKS